MFLMKSAELHWSTKDESELSEAIKIWRPTFSSVLVTRARGWSATPPEANAAEEMHKQTGLDPDAFRGFKRMICSMGEHHININKGYIVWNMKVFTGGTWSWLYSIKMVRFTNSGFFPIMTLSVCVCWCNIHIDALIYVNTTKAESNPLIFNGKSGLNWIKTELLRSDVTVRCVVTHVLLNVPEILFYLLKLNIIILIYLMLL